MADKARPPSKWWWVLPVVVATYLLWIGFFGWWKGAWFLLSGVGRVAVLPMKPLYVWIGGGPHWGLWVGVPWNMLLVPAVVLVAASLLTGWVVYCLVSTRGPRLRVLGLTVALVVLFAVSGCGSFWNTTHQGISARGQVRVKARYDDSKSAALVKAWSNGVKYERTFAGRIHEVAAQDTPPVVAVASTGASTEGYDVYVLDCVPGLPIRQRWSLGEHLCAVRALCLSPNAEALAAYCWEDPVAGECETFVGVWDAATGGILSRCSLPSIPFEFQTTISTEGVSSLSFSPDSGSIGASGGWAEKRRDGIAARWLCVWNADDGSLVNSFRTPFSGFLALSSQGRYAVVVKGERGLVYDVRAGEAIHWLDCPVRDIAVWFEGEQLCFCDSKGRRASVSVSELSRGSKTSLVGALGRHHTDVADLLRQHGAKE